ncbi:MAG: hypothetical protein U1A22_08985 [Xanthomonadaceae bacterium]|nr:hypothetical protein [Xanthomonadaceae bacterium]
MLVNVADVTETLTLMETELRDEHTPAGRNWRLASDDSESGPAAGQLILGMRRTVMSKINRPASEPVMSLRRP